MEEKLKKGEKGEEEDQEKNKVRITLTSRDLKNVERVCTELISRAREREQIKVTGPVRMPRKNLRITVRKSPCGEGTNTFDRFEMRIYKRIIDFVCTNKEIKEITSIKISPGVEVELSVASED